MTTPKDRSTSIQKYPFIFISLGVLLAACSGGSNTNQTALTNAQLVTPAASCNEIVQEIQAMDRIIMQSQGGSGANYGNMASKTVNTGLAATGAIYKVPGVRELSGLASGFGNGGGHGNQIKTQQGYQAQSEKQRLIGLFQQKRCVRVP